MAKLTVDDRTQIRRLSAQGWSAPVIAASFGVHATTAWRVIGKGNAPPVLSLTFDGKPHSGVRDVGSKTCQWCGHQHSGPRETCSAKCRRERRRYREYQAGRLPSARR